MAIGNFTSNQGTQTPILVDTVGGGSVIALQKLDISGLGASGTIWQGGITGTINNGSISVIAGTIASVGTIGTLGLGTITGNLGTIGTLGLGTITGNVGISSGTINVGTVTVGTIPGVGSVSSLGSLGMLNAGTVVIPSGTITTIVAGTQNTLGTVGTIQNIVGGTIGILTNGTISSSGTSTGVGTVTNLGSVTNVGQLYNAGTVQNQLAGTITALQAGTLSPIPTIANVTYGTHGTTGVSIFGTLAGGTGSGAGTEIFITSLSLTIPSTGGSQDASIGWGTNGGTFHAGTGLLIRGNFPPGGGIQKTFWPPVNSGTQAQLTVFQAGAGTVDVDVTYFITASTL